MHAKRIGLCGGSGSGKNEVMDIFANLGITGFDMDEIYHDLISIPQSPCLSELIRNFGNTIINPDGLLNRKELGKIVFNDAKMLTLLNSITHKFVIDAAEEKIAAQNKSEFVIVNAPLMFESSYNLDCNTVICVIADKDIRIARIMKRDNISLSDAQRRINSQKSDEFLKSHCQYTIYNNSSHEAVSQQVTDIFTQIRGMIPNI